jgi:two-component system, response regulator PdtaR
MIDLRPAWPPLAVSGAVAAAAGKDEKSAPSGRQASTDKPLRVLIVEDEGLVALNIQSALADAGFEIVGIVDTEVDAIAAAQKLQPDVIVMDIVLREGSGIAAARSLMGQVKSHIVFVSGNSDPTTLAAASEVRPAAFIRKPFVTENLATLVLNAVKARN